MKYDQEAIAELKAMDFSGDDIAVNTLEGSSDTDYLEVMSEKHGDITALIARAWSFGMRRLSNRHYGGYLMAVPGGNYDKRHHVIDLLKKTTEQEIKYHDGWYKKI